MFGDRFLCASFDKIVVNYNLLFYRTLELDFLMEVCCIRDIGIDTYYSKKIICFQFSEILMIFYDYSRTFCLDLQEARRKKFN